MWTKILAFAIPMTGVLLPALFGTLAFFVKTFGLNRETVYVVIGLVLAAFYSFYATRTMGNAAERDSESRHEDVLGEIERQNNMLTIPNDIVVKMTYRSYDGDEYVEQLSEWAIDLTLKHMGASPGESEPVTLRPTRSEGRKVGEGFLGVGDGGARNTVYFTGFVGAYASFSIARTWNDAEVVIGIDNSVANFARRTESEGFTSGPAAASRDAASGALLSKYFPDRPENVEHLSFAHYAYYADSETSAHIFPYRIEFEIYLNGNLIGATEGYLAFHRSDEQPLDPFVTWDPVRVKSDFFPAVAGGRSGMDGVLLREQVVLGVLLLLSLGLAISAIHVLQSAKEIV